MKTIGSSCFVSFTKACDYYKATGHFERGDETPWEIEQEIRRKIDEGEISIGAPSIRQDEKLLIIDNGTRYAIETPDIDDDRIIY